VEHLLSSGGQLPAGASLPVKFKGAERPAGTLHWLTTLPTERNKPSLTNQIITHPKIA
jgi:hypothetical protein